MALEDVPQPRDLRQLKDLNKVAITRWTVELGSSIRQWRMKLEASAESSGFTVG